MYCLHTGFDCNKSNENSRNIDTSRTVRLLFVCLGVKLQVVMKDGRWTCNCWLANFV